jgi:hypothetical protein
MSFPIPDALTIIRNTILLLKEEEEGILASPDDAAYFRLRHTNAKGALPPPAPIVNSPPPKVEAQKPAQAAPVPKPKAEELLAAPIPELPQKPAEKNKRPDSQFGAILEKIAPELAILDKLPDDKTAKQIANRWKTKNQSAPISVLSSGELPEHKALLEEIATALDVTFGPARLIQGDGIEKEKEWKTFLSASGLKLIVICDSTLWQLHNLRHFYKETPAAGVRTLGETPVFLLPDLSLYLKDPLLKRSLWKAICSRLS